jgi:hypothetical protein
MAQGPINPTMKTPKAQRNKEQSQLLKVNNTTTNTDKRTPTEENTLTTCSEHGPICHLFELILVIHANTSNGTNHIV